MEIAIMDNCIDKDKTILAIQEYWSEIERIHNNISIGETAVYKDILALLKSIEPKRAVERMAYWMNIADDVYECSECHKEVFEDEVYGKPIFEYCPYCGARMNEGFAVQAEWERLMEEVVRKCDSHE